MSEDRLVSDRSKRPGGNVVMMVGAPTGRYKSSTMVLLTRKPRSKWWQVVCFGPKGHYRKDDGGCAHTDQCIECAVERIRPYIRLRPFGDKR